MSDPWYRSPTAAPTQPVGPPAAWYPDPSGVGELRYWDGSAWTPGVVVGGRLTERPMPWPPVATAPAASTAEDDRAHFPGRAVWYAVLGFVVGLVGGTALGFAGDWAGLPDIGVLVLNQLGLWTGIVGACWKASHRFGTGDIRRDYGLRFAWPDLGWGLLLSLGARMAAGVAALPFFFASDRFVGDNSGVFGEVTESWASFLVFAVIAVVGAAIFEELFFRGLLMRSLQSAMPIAWAIAVQALLFGLAHVSPLLGLVNFSVAASTAAAGVIFGIAAWWRRVGTSVFSHAAFNLVSVIAAAFILF